MKPQLVEVREETCTFSEMVPLFQALFDPEPSRLTALIGRMKNFLRLGAMPGVCRSQGRTAYFCARDVWELLCLMELGDIGIGPQKAIELFRANPHMAYRAGLSGRLPVNRRPTSHLFIDADWLLPAARQHLPQLFGEKSLDTAERLARRMGGTFLGDTGEGFPGTTF